MTATDVLASLQQRGVTLTVDGTRIRYRAPAGAITDDDRAALRAHKQELLVLLALPSATQNALSPPALKVRTRAPTRDAGLSERAGQVQHQYPLGGACGVCGGRVFRLRGTPKADTHWTFVCSHCADAQAAAADASLGWVQQRAERLIGDLYRRLNDASAVSADTAPLPLPPFDDRGIDAACNAQSWEALVAAIDVVEEQYRTALTAHAGAAHPEGADRCLRP